ncbi:MAG: aquaporin family protein [Candidatus Nanopelagicales bacterium]|jgi:glycerol uptake facilitator-like aquaporin|nr:aquaporin family protein [Candidatus Nanopelagicales bacterium]
MHVVLVGAARRTAAEFLGGLVLVATVVGSGIMATALTEDVGLQLLMNMVATVLVLGLLIWTLGPISGAHFNPAVTLVALVRGEIPGREAATYVPAQVAGAIAGAVLANLMYALPAAQVATTVRSGSNLLLGEVVATAGLLWIIGALTRTGNGRLGPALVPAWIGAAYLFTSSTSFANPAVTIGRMFSDTFAGIAPASVPTFLAAQLAGAAIGAAQTELFHPRPGRTPEPLDLPAPVHATQLEDQ